MFAKYSTSGGVRARDGLQLASQSKTLTPTLALALTPTPTQTLNPTKREVEGQSGRWSLAGFIEQTLTLNLFLFPSYLRAEDPKPIIGIIDCDGTEW